jgi:hypothetical protein
MEDLYKCNNNPKQTSSCLQDADIVIGRWTTKKEDGE